MKFKQYLAEGQGTQKDWEEFRAAYSVRATKGDVEFDGKIKIKPASAVSSLKIAPFSTIGNKPKKLELPFDPNQWDVASVIFNWAEVADLKNLPNVVTLHFSRSIVKSLKSGGHLTKLKYIAFEQTNTTEPIPMLQLFKLPILEMIAIHPGSFGLDEKRSMKLQHILTDTLRGDRDIVACQSELIDEGFEEFAKL